MPFITLIKNIGHRNKPDLVSLNGRIYFNRCNLKRLNKEFEAIFYQKAQNALDRYPWEIIDVPS